jgi:hypothetical protein
MSMTIEVLGVDCTESTTHVVSLAVEDPLALVEQKSFPDLAEFTDYWLSLFAYNSRPLVVVAEDTPSDPHNIIGLMEQSLPVDRQYVAFRDGVYAQPLRKLKIKPSHARAGTLALNKAHEILASEAAESFLAKVSELRQSVHWLELEACRLKLALNSSIYRRSMVF